MTSSAHWLGIEYRRRILEIVKKATLPLNVDNVRARAKISNWESTKSILLELALEGKIKAARTAGGWIFWSPETVSM